MEYGLTVLWFTLRSSVTLLWGWKEGKKWGVEFISYKEMSYVRDKVWNKEEKI